MKISAIWDVRLCSMVKRHYHFTGIWYLHLHGRRTLAGLLHFFFKILGMKVQWYDWTLWLTCSQPDGYAHPKAVGPCRLLGILSGIEPCNDPRRITLVYSSSFLTLRLQWQSLQIHCQGIRLWGTFGQKGKLGISTWQITLRKSWETLTQLNASNTICAFEEGQQGSLCLKSLWDNQ